MNCCLSWGLVQPLRQLLNSNSKLFQSDSIPPHHQYIDPGYNELEDEANYQAFEIILKIMMALYGGWLTYYMIRSFGEIKRLDPPFLFTFMFTVAMIILSLVCLAIGAMYVIPQAPSLFLLFYGMTNSYVWVLSWAYCPDDNQHTRLVEESEGNEADGLGLGPLSNQL